MHYARQLQITDIAPAPRKVAQRILPPVRISDMGGAGHHAASFPAALPRNRGDGVDNRFIAGEAAVIAGESSANFLPVRTWRHLQKRLCRHQHSRSAIAALQGVTFMESGLKIGNRIALRQTLDGLHRAAGSLNREYQTAMHQLAVEQHETGATHTHFAPQMSTGQPQPVTQEIGKAGARLDNAAR